MSDMLHQMLGAFHPEDAKMKLMQAAYLPGQTVADVAEYSGLSCRTINRYFAGQFGLPLKRFLSIVRFRSTFPSIGSGVLWPDVECYDQSHFIREVKAFSGVPPKTLYKNIDGRYLQFPVRKKE